MTLTKKVCLVKDLMSFPTHWSSYECSLFLDPPSSERNMPWCAEGEKQPWLCPWTQERHPGKATDLKVTEAERVSLAMTLIIYWPWFLFSSAQPHVTSLALYLSKQEHSYLKFSNYPVTPKLMAKNTTLYQTNLGSKALSCIIAKKTPKQNKTSHKHKQTKQEKMLLH